MLKYLTLYLLWFYHQRVNTLINLKALIIDWTGRPVNDTLVCVVRQSVHGVSMAWHIAGAVQDISATANSTTSYGGHSRELRFQLWRSPEVWVVTMTSVQMVSCCCPGQKANHWHGTSQYQTPMPTPTSLTRRPQQGRQLTRRRATRRPNTDS